jgi:hypothetical protein
LDPQQEGMERLASKRDKRLKGVKDELNIRKKSGFSQS